MSDYVKVDAAVSAIVKVELDNVSAGALAKTTFHEDIRKMLGGNSTITLATASTLAVSGYVNGSPNPYAQATGTATKLFDLSTGGQFMFIKHTGHAYSSTTELGDVTTDDLYVLIGCGDYSTDTAIIILKPGMAILLPNIKDTGGTVDIAIQRSGTTSIAVEYAKLNIS